MHEGENFVSSPGPTPFHFLGRPGKMKTRGWSIHTWAGGGSVERMLTLLLFPLPLLRQIHIHAEENDAPYKFQRQW
jgi:hypothetical protein